MPKRKCPACGSTNTVKILFGLPSCEGFEAHQRGEVVLGGRCVFPNSPKRACKNCGQQFGNKNSELRNMCFLDFFVGGYFGTSYSVYIDIRQTKKVLKYGRTPGGMLIDLRNEIADEDHHKHNVVIRDIDLSNEQWSGFINEIASCEVEYWKDSYLDNSICDGTQWRVEIGLPKGQKIYKSGSNAYPPAWKKFIKILRKYVDMGIG